MTSRTKEEQELLDEKIARIQKKNEEILRRRKEVEEDKRLAEQQNAVVKLRPSTANTNRERTPALKLSKRELRKEFSDENYETVGPEGSGREGSRVKGGGVERFRGQDDRKETVAHEGSGREGPRAKGGGVERYRGQDDHKETVAPEGSGREGSRAKGVGVERYRGQDDRKEPVATEGSGKEGPRVKGSEVERYRAHGDQKATGPPPDPRSFLYDDERYAPLKDRDEKSDGRRDSNRWRREMEQEQYKGWREFERGGQQAGNEHRVERGKHRGRGGVSRSQWEAWREERKIIDEARIQRQKSGDGKWRREWDSEKIVQEVPEKPRFEPRRIHPQDLRRPINHYHCAEHRGTDRVHRESTSRSRGRGRGRLHLAELEIPVDSTQLEMFKIQINPAQQGDSDVRFVGSLQRPEKYTDMRVSYSQEDSKKQAGARRIEHAGKSLKISVFNLDLEQSTPKPQCQVSENRGRFRSQPSYSSQSDEDSPRDRGSTGNHRPRSHKYQRAQGKVEASPIETTVVLSADSKPPLPPSKSKINEDDDGSWEDVTTSGTESLGEDLLTTHSTPPNRTDESESKIVDSLEHQFNQNLEKVVMFASDKSSESGVGALDKKDDQSQELDKGNEFNECISLEVSYNTSTPDVSFDGTASSNTVKCSVPSNENCAIIASSTIYTEAKLATESETEQKVEMLFKENFEICSEEAKTESSASVNKEGTLDLSFYKTSLEKTRPKSAEATNLLSDQEYSAEKEDLQFDKNVKKVGVFASDRSSESGGEALDKEDVGLKQNHEFDKGNELDECIILKVSYNTSTPDVSFDGSAGSNTVMCSADSSESGNESRTLDLSLNKTNLEKFGPKIAESTNLLSDQEYSAEKEDLHFDKNLEKVGVLTSDRSSESGFRALDKEDVVLDQSHELDECISLEVSYITSASDVSIDGTAGTNTIEVSVTSTENCDITASSAIYTEAKHATKRETESNVEVFDKKEIKICSEELKTESSESFKPHIDEQTSAVHDE